MRYCYWCNRCPYTQHCSQINYPASAYPDGYMIPLPEYYSDDFSLEAREAEFTKPVEADGEAVRKSINSDSSMQHVTIVIETVMKRAAQEIDEIKRVGMDTKLLDYLIRTMVQYINKNSDRYQGSIQRKAEMAIFDMKRDLGWAFDLMRIYNISFATENRLLDKLAKAAVQDLQPGPPAQTTI